MAGRLRQQLGRVVGRNIASTERVNFHSCDAETGTTPEYSSFTRTWRLTST